MMDLKQDFWSMRGQRTYLLLGLFCLRVSKHRTILMPVAIGTTKQAAVLWAPKEKDKKMYINPFSAKPIFAEKK